MLMENFVILCAVSSGAKSKPARKTSQSGSSSTGGQGKVWSCMATCMCVHVHTQTHTHTLSLQKSKSSAKDALAEAGKNTNYSELALFDKVGHEP